jgi:hypothetical protein
LSSPTNRNSSILADMPYSICLPRKVQILETYRNSVELRKLTTSDPHKLWWANPYNGVRYRTHRSDKIFTKPTIKRAQRPMVETLFLAIPYPF